jgi:hypothetical protein
VTTPKEFRKEFALEEGDQDPQKAADRVAALI